MDQWFYSRNGQQAGPVTWTVLQQLAATGQVAYSDMIWNQSMPDWVSASTMPGLFPAGALQPPVAGYYAQYPAAKPPAGPVLITFGYVCAAISLLFCPIGFGIGGIVIGIICLNRQAKGNGTAIIALSTLCMIIGVIFGVYVFTHQQHSRF